MNQFSEIIYNDFKKRDIPDYEYPFLECILSILNDEKFIKCLLSNFDFVLYLLERRDRPKEICQKKFDVIQKIIQNENIMIKNLFLEIFFRNLLYLVFCLFLIF